MNWFRGGLPLIIQVPLMIYSSRYDQSYALLLKNLVDRDTWSTCIYVGNHADGLYIYLKKVS